MTNFLGADAPIYARAAFRARLALLDTPDYEAALLVEDPPGTEVSRHADGGVSVYVPGPDTARAGVWACTADSGPFTPCSDSDWERLVAAAAFWCAPERRIFGAEANLRDLEDTIDLAEGACGPTVKAGDIRLALRYCGWKPNGRPGSAAVWKRTETA